MDLQLLLDALSLITIVMCFLLKIPQILKLISVKSTYGISLQALLLELTSYTVMTSYNYISGYAVLSYLEYPVILVQQFILIYLVLKYRDRINEKTILCAVVYFILSICLALDLIPRILLSILVPMCTPISASSKIFQMLAIINAGNADSVSPLTWFISAFTNLTRVITIWTDSTDILLLANFLVSSILSLSVMSLTIYYKYGKHKTLQIKED